MTPNDRGDVKLCESHESITPSPYNALQQLPVDDDDGHHTLPLKRLMMILMMMTMVVVIMTVMVMVVLMMVVMVIEATTPVASNFDRLQKSNGDKYARLQNSSSRDKWAFAR